MFLPVIMFFDSKIFTNFFLQIKASIIPTMQLINKIFVGCFKKSFIISIVVLANEKSGKITKVVGLSAETKFIVNTPINKASTISKVNKPRKTIAAIITRIEVIIAIKMYKHFVLKDMRFKLFANFVTRTLIEVITPIIKLVK